MLVVEVVDVEPVVTAPGRPHRTGAQVVLEAQRGEVRARGPALRPDGQFHDLGLLECQADATGDETDFAVIQRELGHTDLEEPPGRPQAADREAWERSAGEDEGRLVEDVVGECGDERDALARPEDVHVVEDEHERVGSGRQRGRESREPVRAAPPDGRERVKRVHRRDVTQRRGDVLGQDDRVVVLLAERDPGERPAIALGPLREHGRLAVSGRSENRHDGP